MAEYVEKNLLTDEESILRLVLENRTLGQRIMEFIDKLLAKLGNKKAQEREFLSKARRYYADALAESQASGTFGQQEQVRNMERLQEQMASGELTEDEAWQVFNEIYDAELDLQNGLRGNLYSYAGENAKSANLRTLTEAQEMEKAGAAMESIRKATGWHRGMDGKWRFEIDDSAMEYDRSGDAQRAVSRQWAMEDLDAAKEDLKRKLNDDEMRDVRRYNSAWLNGNETEVKRLYKQNAEKYGEVFTDYVEALEWANEFSGQASDGKRLGDYLKHDALFEAYPRLKNAELRFEEMADGVRGSYNEEENRISISRDLRDAPEDTLIHEIQHAIQDIEGFTPGASPEYWARREYESGDFVTERLQEKYSKIINGLTREELNKYIRYNELEGELERLFLSDENSEDGRRYAKYEAEQDALYEELYPNKWFKDLLDLSRRMSDTQGEYQSMYRNTAGEIEARDVSNRRNLTEEQRREVAPDYGNEDTVFADKGSGYAMSQGEQDSVKEQIREHQDTLNNMKTVATIRDNGWDGMSKGEFRQKIINDLKKTGYRVDNPSIGVVEFDEKLLNRSLNYIQTDAEAAAYQAIPKVLKRGIEISGHGDHKGRGYETLTIAAPIELNGKRGNMAVVVMKTKGSRYKVHRVLAPDGTTFDLPQMTNAEPTTAGTITNGSQSLGGSTPAISSASESSIAGNTEFDKGKFSISEEENLSDLDREQLAALESMKEGARQVETEQLRQTLPVKARQYLARAERVLLTNVQNALGVDKFSDKAALMGTIQEISNEYLKHGKLTQERADALFEKAYKQGIVMEKEFYERYKGIKDKLRTTAVTLDPEYASSIPDVKDFRKAAFGRRRSVLAFFNPVVCIVVPPAQSGRE